MKLPAASLEELFTVKQQGGAGACSDTQLARIRVWLSDTSAMLDNMLNVINGDLKTDKVLHNNLFAYLGIRVSQGGAGPALDQEHHGRLDRAKRMTT